MENITINDIKDAKKVIGEYARRTPLIKSYYLTSVTGGEIFLKMENMQLTGSFKFRGAFNKINSLTQEERDKGVIACSAGNHAQGVALSCKLLGLKGRIYMPTTAPAAKVAATQGYGCEVVQFGETFDECKAECERVMAETGEIFLHPYDDKFVMAGQGTIGIEIIEDLWDVDTIIAPIGGGGLIAGVATAIKSINPSINIIGVQAENVHGMKASLDAGKIVSNYTAPTLADGCAVKTPGVLTYDVVKDEVSQIVTVTEEEIELALKDMIQRCKIVAEGSGAMPIAALESGKIDPKYIDGKKVVGIVSGGNIDLAKIVNTLEGFYIH